MLALGVEMTRGRPVAGTVGIAVASLLAVLSVTAVGQQTSPGSTVSSPAVLAALTASPSPARLERVSWRRLKFSASKFFMSAQTAVTVDYLPSSAVAADILAPPEGQARPLPSPTVAVVSSETDLPFGKHEVATVWLDPATGAVVQGHKIAQGRDPYEKYFRYTTEGFYFWRNSPQASSERSQPPEKWGKRRQRMVRAAAPLTPAQTVTDSYALFYLASAARLDRKDATLKTYLLQDEKLVELTFTARELRQVRCDVKVVRGSGEETKTAATVRRVVLSGRLAGQPAGTSGEDVDLGLMDLRGSLAMLVEVGTGIPIEISGRTGSIGDLTVSLDRINLE